MKLKGGKITSSVGPYSELKIGVPFRLGLRRISPNYIFKRVDNSNKYSSVNSSPIIDMLEFVVVFTEERRFVCLCDNMYNSSLDRYMV